MEKLLKILIPGLLIALTYFQMQCTTSEGHSLPDVVDYNFHIRPILSDRCFHCHGPDANKREADLRLDTENGAYAALKDNPDAHVIVKGKPELSELYLRISTSDTSLKMPPPSSNLSLNEEEIKIIKKWIEQGAPIKKHWSFLKPEKSKLPEANEEWVRNPIDNFIYDKMKSAGLKPSEEAGKETLLKRLSFDLTGLPPTIEMQEAFLKDESPQAYENVVNRLLSDKHFGEKMAINWLDVARYADSHGYQDDGLRTMWPWRDWVIHAFNSNYSYKKFITWQLAGDILAEKMKGHPKAKEMILATGFNRNHKITQEGGVIDEEYRVEYVTDRTNTFGKSMLALTLECSKCHSHKFDPISQEEYFGTFAFFNQVPEKGLFGTIDASFADPPNMRIKDEDIKSIFKFINKKDTARLDVMVMKDSSKIRPTYLLERGNYDAHGKVVDFGPPAAIMPFRGFEKNRLGLTLWMFDPQNPLTSRVFVNRIWEQFFGRGIVKTLGDFGMQGELPTHPELLDWLSVDFRENGWNMKRLVKQIVMSATYRQSSTVTEKHLKTDPENKYLSRMSRLRFPAEIVRDHVLASSDLLNQEIGGPSVKPYQPKGLWEVATSGRGTLARYVQDHGKELYRRGMYVFIKRTVPPPSMLIFDASNRDQCEVQRGRTNTPLQALAMLNDPHVLESSRVMAQSELMNKKSIDQALTDGFRKIVCRKPSFDELKILKAYFEDEMKYFQKNPKKIEALKKIGEYENKSVKNNIELAALLQTYQMIYNMEETLIRI
ncbi:MAG: PSD1 domain-containing protein [Cytophagaceae bacterium]|nr:PSD1 domain-containing protein [Cytophagaceae bacterium]